MNTQNFDRPGYDARTPEQRELAELQEQKVKMTNLRAERPYDGPRAGRDETPDHLGVGACINLLRNDVNQLLNEIEELRARLSPVLSEQKTERVDRRGPRPPVKCEMASELEAIHSTISQARENVYFTLAQLDL